MRHTTTALNLSVRQWRLHWLHNTAFTLEKVNLDRLELAQGVRLAVLAHRVITVSRYTTLQHFTERWKLSLVICKHCFQASALTPYLNGIVTGLASRLKFSYNQPQSQRELGLLKATVSNRTRFSSQIEVAACKLHHIDIFTPRYNLPLFLHNHDLKNFGFRLRAPLMGTRTSSSSL